MPAERKISVELEGKTHELPVPAGFVHEDDLKELYIPKDQFQGELTRRVQSVTKDLKRPEDLLADPEFFKTFVDTRKEDLMKTLEIKPGDKDMDVTKIQTEVMERIRRDEVAPLQTQMKGASDEIDILRVRDLDGQVVQAGSMLRVVPDLQDLVKIFVRQRAGWDGERKQWFIKKLDGSEGFEFSADPNKGGYPYMTVREFLEKDKRSNEHKNWYEAGTQEGADFRGGHGSSDARSMNVEQFQKLPPAERTKFAQDYPAEFAALMQQIRIAGEDRLFNKGPIPALVK